jgi:catechol 2,3-dioxygenase-like lactoylglutathione lyase family enzyme
MQIKRLQHCGLVVSDLERSRWFYGTVLGMKEAPRPRTFIFDGAWFRSGEDELIMERDTTAPAGLRDAGAAKSTGLATHIAFEVTDLAAMKES